MVIKHTPLAWHLAWTGWSWPCSKHMVSIFESGPSPFARIFRSNPLSLSDFLSETRFLSSLTNPLADLRPAADLCSEVNSRLSTSINDPRFARQTVEQIL